MSAASCANCGTPLPERARFCPECGLRVDAGPDETTVEALPQTETGPVPVEHAVATPRFFGVTRPSAVLALAAASLAAGIVLLATSHWIVGGVLVGIAILLGIFFVSLERRVPDSAVTRVSNSAARSLRAHAGYAKESVAAHSAARMELFRQRRELADLVARRAEGARALGEAVYAGDQEGTEFASVQLAELDGLVSAKEDEMQQTAEKAMERINRAQLQVQPTQVETPEPPPEPYPEPSPPPQPVPVPEPTPEPSEPPGPAHVPEPSPTPSPPPQNH